jgi:hypothetical protein
MSPLSSIIRGTPSVPNRTNEKFHRKLASFLALITTIATGCAELPPRDESFASRAITFNSDELGKLPPDFTTALTGGGGPVSWVVRDKPPSPDGKPVLVQESSERINYRFPLCVYDNVTARDVAAEVKWRPISGWIDEAGGIILRYTPDNYYIARANALENNVILFKTVRGKRSKIKEVPVPVAMDQWHTLRFEAQGRRLKIIFDGKTVIERTDRTFSYPGKVGLWTKADSVSAFTDFRIEAAP